MLHFAPTRNHLLNPALSFPHGPLNLVMSWCLPYLSLHTAAPPPLFPSYRPNRPRCPSLVPCCLSLAFLPSVSLGPPFKYLLPKGLNASPGPRSLPRASMPP